MTPMDTNNEFSFIEKLPCPGYVLLSDANLTICAANMAFLQQIGCDSKKLGYLYASKLSAFMDVEPFHRFLLSEMPNAAFQHKAMFNDSEYFFYTQLTRIPDNSNSDYILCISFNITEYVTSLNALQSYKDTADLAFCLKGCGLFEWDINTDRVNIINSCSLFNTLAQDLTIQKLKLHLNANTQMETSQINSLFDRTLTENAPLDCEFSYKSDAGILQWYRLAITDHSSPSGKKVIGIVEDITDKKTIFLNYLKEMQFYHLLLTEKTAYGQVDITEDRILMVGGLWNLYNELIHHKSYSQIAVEFINKVVHPDDRPHYLELMDRETLIQSFSKGISNFGCEFRRIVEQNKMSWMKLSIRLFSEPYSGHLMGQLYIENIEKPGKIPSSDASACLPGAEKNKAAFVSESQFNTFVGRQGDMAYLVDPDTFELLCGNDAFYDRIGLTSEECRGLKCYQVMYHRESPCPFCGKVNWSVDKFFLWRDFNSILEQELLIKNKLVEWEGRQVLLALAVDISNDKSVVDSISCAASESHIILSSVEHMSNCSTFEESLKSVLDSIAFFFQADMATCWLPQEESKSLSCISNWTDNKSSMAFDQADTKAVIAFCSSGKWDDCITLDCPEAAIGYSSEMYRMMQKRGFFNQRWKMLVKGMPERGIIMVSNCRANLQNVSFIDSISHFITNEVEKRKLLTFIYYSNNHDRLTGLLNRTNYESYLQAFNPDQISSLGVILANIDNLNEVNTSRGEKMGNKYIKHFAEILLELFGPDKAYRLNGNEFLIITTDISRAQLELLIYNLSAKVNRQTNYSVSLGYAWDDIEKSLKEMIMSALEAMKLDKKNHSKTNIAPLHLETGKMLKGLMQDLRDRRYRIYLQPKFNMETGCLTGAEALSRLVDKEQNIISPAQFIPPLETHHLIRYIDLYVFREVCLLLQKWKNQNRKAIKISLNFSPLTLCEKDILANIEHILDEFDIERENIEIEITESIIAEDRGIISQTTRAMSHMGYNLSLDDFGVRYANLSMLADIRFHTVKLDKSLIKTLEDCIDNQLILKNIIHLCKDLKINVIAEGVETQEQRNILNTLECPFGQGYLFGKPVPIEEFEKVFLEKMG